MRYLIAFFLLCSSMVSANEGDLLEPEQAFKISARALDGQTLEVRYQIAEGYYLYKEKFKFQAEPQDVVLGAPQLPVGKVKQDEYFGKVETYRQDLIIKLPLTRTSTLAQSLTLRAVSQGCADAGVCYPPTTQTAQLTLPAAAPETSTRAPSGLAALTALVKGSAQDEFLEPDQAFKLARSYAAEQMRIVQSGAEREDLLAA